MSKMSMKKILIGGALLFGFLSVESRAIYTTELPTKGFQIKKEDGTFSELGKEQVHYTGWSGLSSTPDGIVILSDIVEKRDSWILYMGIMSKRGEQLLPVEITTEHGRKMKTLHPTLKFSEANKTQKRVTAKKRNSKNEAEEKSVGINIWKGTTNDVPVEISVEGNLPSVSYMEFPYNDTKAITYGTCSVDAVESALNGVLTNLHTSTNNTSGALSSILSHVKRLAASKPNAASALIEFEAVYNKLQRVLS